MRKILTVLCAFVLCCSIVLGNDQLNSSEAPAVNQGKLVQEGTTVQQDGLSLKETILNSFSNEQIKDFYSSLIKDDNHISQGEVARLICHYIEREPIYVPEQGLNNPYIGRLVLEYIWGNLPYNEERLITAEEWTTLFSKAESFKNDKDYAKKALAADKSKMKQKMSSYIKTINKEETYKNVTLGTLSRSHLILGSNQKTYDMYEFLNTAYVALDTLEAIGFKSEKVSYGYQLLWEAREAQAQPQRSLDRVPVFLSNIPVYIGELKTDALSDGKNLFIPARALQVYFNLDITDNLMLLTPKDDVVSQYILCDGDNIINQTGENLKITYTDIYWNGKELIENKSEPTEVMANGKLIKNKKLYVLNNKVYLTTLINQLETEDGVVIESNNKLGQDNSELLIKYDAAVSKLNNNTGSHNNSGSNNNTSSNSKDNKDSNNKELFPASIIIGTMKYSTSGFVKGQKVEVWAAEDKVKYFVKNSKGKVVNIPWNSISIPKNPPVAKDKPTKAQIEAFVNSKDLSSRTEYLVWTDLYRQQTYIFKGEKNEWQLIKRLICSSGKNKTPTPRGVFELQGRVAYFGVDKGYRCKNAFQIFGDYLYHSIIFDVTGTRLIEGMGVLGTRASHGCIRFSEKDSLWFYNTMKVHTRIWIN